MSNDELLFAAGSASALISKLCKEAWDKQALAPAEAHELTAQARQLLCAAVELENRAVGNEPPKVG